MIVRRIDFNDFTVSRPTADRARRFLAIAREGAAPVSGAVFLSLVGREQEIFDNEQLAAPTTANEPEFSFSCVSELKKRRKLFEFTLNSCQQKKKLLENHELSRSLKSCKATLFPRFVYLQLLGRLFSYELDFDRRLYVVFERRLAEGLHWKKAFLSRVFDPLVFRLVIVRYCKMLGLETMKGVRRDLARIMSWRQALESWTRNISLWMNQPLDPTQLQSWHHPTTDPRLVTALTIAVRYVQLVADGL